MTSRIRVQATIKTCPRPSKTKLRLSNECQTSKYRKNEIINVKQFEKKFNVDLFPLLKFKNFLSLSLIISSKVVSNIKKYINLI